MKLINTLQSILANVASAGHMSSGEPNVLVLYKQKVSPHGISIKLHCPRHNTVFVILRLKYVAKFLKANIYYL